MQKKSKNTVFDFDFNLMHKKSKNAVFDFDFEFLQKKSKNNVFDFDFDLMHKKSKKQRSTLPLTWLWLGRAGACRLGLR